MSPEVIVEAAGPLGDAPSRPIKAFYNLCGYDPSEESPILLSWIGDFFLSGGLPKMATCSESKQFTVCTLAAPLRERADTITGSETFLAVQSRLINRWY